MGGEHATFRLRVLIRGCVEQVESVHGVVSQHLPILVDLNRQQLRGLLASMLAGVAVAAFEAESVGAAMFSQLSLACQVIVGSGRAARSGHPHCSRRRL